MKPHRPASGLPRLSRLPRINRPTRPIWPTRLTRLPWLGQIARLVVVLSASVCVAASAASPTATDRLPSDDSATQVSISQLIADAAPGDTLRVPAGDYREDAEIIIDKPLTLLGSPGAVLYGSESHGILLVTADRVTIRGFVLRDVGTSFMDDRAAIQVEGAANCEISDNTFEDNFFAIYLAETAGCTIANNTISSTSSAESHSGNGIHAWYCRDLVVSNNKITGHRDGIYFEFVEDSVVEGNESFLNLRYGLHFMFSDRCRYADNTFRSNGAGVAVMYSEGISVVHNRFSENRGSAAYGLLLKEIDDAELKGNAFVDNSVGVYMEGSNRVTVEGNAFLKNGWALKVLANSEDTSFLENDFAGNTFDVATNSRRTVSTFSGNYWDEYEGYDLDGDHVGDLPFRPVSLFSLMVEQNEASVVLLGSLFVDLLDLTERLVPSITPENLVDSAPSTRPRTDIR